MLESVYRISYTFRWYPVSMDLMYNRGGYPLKNYGSQLGWFRIEIINNKWIVSCCNRNMSVYIYEISENKYSCSPDFKKYLQ